jgi:hypothetical protein
MIPQDLSGDAEVSVQVRVGTPYPVFVQVFILMALGMTICVSYARGGFVTVIRWRGENFGRLVSGGQRRVSKLG